MKRTIQILFLFILLTLWALPAQAGDPHAHHNVAPEKQFKFDNGNSLLPFHCQLLGHSLKHPCPHIQQTTEGVTTTRLMADCGGGPASSLPSGLVLAGKNLEGDFVLPIDLPDGNSTTWVSAYSFHTFSRADTEVPPPRT